MYRHRRRGKGFISVYTLILLTLVMEILLCSLKLHFMSNTYNNNLIEIRLKKEDIQEKQSVLLTKVNKYIKDNAKDICKLDEKIINDILEKIKPDEISYKQSFIENNHHDKSIILHLKVKEGKYRKEYYRYFLDEENQKRIRFNLIKVEY